MSQQIITVIGASGVQGGFVAQAFSLHRERWKVRGVTRDKKKAISSSSPTSSLPIEWVEADLNDRQSLISAFTNSTAVFGVTSSFDRSLKDNREQETQQGINIAEAAEAAGVKYLIWSCLPDTRKLSSAKYIDIKHTFLKAEVTQYIKKHSSSWKLLPFFLLPGSYIQNYLYRFPPKKAADGTIIFSLPASGHVKLDLLNIDQWGDFIYTLLSSPAASSSYAGKEITVSRERLTGNDLASIYTQVTGQAARYEQLSDHDFIAAFKDEAMGKELLEMFHYYDEFGLFGSNPDDQTAKSIYPALLTYKEYLSKSGYRIDRINEQMRKLYGGH